MSVSKVEAALVHYDLFAGIGGFSLALDTIFHDQKIKHIFVENDPFCTAVLKKHWPEAEYYGDIRTLSRERLTADTNGRRQAEQELETTGDKQCDRGATADTEGSRQLRAKQYENNSQGEQGRSPDDINTQNQEPRPFILTGGFPCQPFSQAGKRKGTADDRHLWPEMFRVIREFSPDWVIAENVYGLITWNEGMVLEQVCADLESEKYEVQPFIIPAVAKNAPHRRDRVWIIANRTSKGLEGEKHQKYTLCSKQDCNAPDPRQQLRKQRSGKGMETNQTIRATGTISNQRGGKPDWDRNWQEVAFATCHDGMDDGLPRQMDRATISATRHRQERLKACGNAIVPQVAMEIFKAIRRSYG